MTKLRDLRSRRKRTQIENTGIYVKNVPVSDLDSIEDKVDALRGDRTDVKFNDDEAFLYILFQDYLTDKDGERFEDIEGPEDIKEVVDIEVVHAILNFFGMGANRRK